MILERNVLRLLLATGVGLLAGCADLGGPRDAEPLEPPESLESLAHPAPSQAVAPLAGEGLASCAPGTDQPSYRHATVYAGEREVAFDAAVAEFAKHPIVLIGEQHDRLDHHLNQAQVLCRLHARGVPVAVGFEAFGQPVQAVLDEYVRGEIDLATLLERSEYYRRWRFDHRLYVPLLAIARRHRIPVVALNIPNERARSLAVGAGRLADEDRQYFPYGLPVPRPQYRARMARHFEAHPRGSDADLERFTWVQWSWDQAMGQRAVRYVRNHPERVLIVIAGAGHVDAPGAMAGAITRASGGRIIPLRVAQPPETLSSSAPGDGHRVHWRLVSEARHLPPSGRLGVFLEPAAGALVVKSLAPDSGAGEAGVQAGDHLVRVDGRPASTFTEVKLALLDRAPGSVVVVEIRRPGESRLRRAAVTLR